MRLFRSAAMAAGEIGVDRRAAGRVRVDCPARLHLPSGFRPGRLVNLSEQGVRMEMDKPPQTGLTVLLQWRSHEVFCKVIWVIDDACGLNFERPIARAIVLETAGQDDAGGPVARHGNIPLGQKRTLRREAD